MSGKKGMGWGQKLLLIVVVVVNLALYGIVFVLSRGLTEKNEAPSVVTPEVVVDAPVQLSSAYEQALALAQSWQTDAQLVSATTNWQLAAGERLTLERPAWSFSFYSAATNQIQTVNVDQRGAQFGRRQSAGVTPQRAESDWALGSEDLLLTFLSYGGQNFINEHPNTNIHLQLRAEDTGKSVWYITAVDPVERQSLIVGVDANTRQIVVSEMN